MRACARARRYTGRARFRRMNAGKSYAAGLEIGDVMLGEGVGEVVESRHPGFSPGEWVLGYFGWQEWALSDGARHRARKVDTGAASGAPPQAYLGVLGMPGVTAHVGLFAFGDPKPGETVVVSAAAGAVGSIVGQLAKAHGCRVVGIAGGARKCELVTTALGFDACVDYKAEDFLAQVRDARAPARRLRWSAHRCSNGACARSSPRQHRRASTCCSRTLGAR